MPDTPPPADLVDLMEDEPVTGSSRLVDEKVRAFWEWWAHASAAAGGVPRRSSFNIVEHATWAPNLFVICREDDAFKFRLRGEAVKEMLGMPTRGPRFREGEYVIMGTASRFKRDLHEYYSRVLASGHGWRCSGLLPFAGKDHIRFESVDLPFRRGPEPDTIIGLITRRP